MENGKMLFIHAVGVNAETASDADIVAVDGVLHDAMPGATQP